MKKIESKVMVEQVQVIYEAADGTRFFSEAECKEYEKSAKCAIRAAVREMAIVDTDGYAVFSGGCVDQQVYIVEPKTDEDLKKLRTYEAYIRQKYDSKFKTEEGSFPESVKGKRIMVVIGYDEDWIDTRMVDSIVELLTKKGE